MRRFLLIFFLFFSFNISADDWKIEQFDNTFSLSKNGEIAHGNNFVFEFNSDNECQVDAYFMMYTTYTDEVLMDVFKNENIRILFGGNDIGAWTKYSFELGSGQVSFLYVTYDNFFSDTFISMTEDLLKGDYLEIKIKDEYKQYYDIQEEYWNFNNFRKNINKVYEMCLKNY